MQPSGSLANTSCVTPSSSLIGLVALVIGAEFLVRSSESIARSIGVSDLVIGLSLVAIGTGLPELATTVVAVLRKETGIAFGNVVGSNLFNMLSIGGITALIRPLPVPLHMRSASTSR